MVSEELLESKPQLRFQYDVAKGYIVVLRKTNEKREGKGGHKYSHWETVGHIKYYRDTLSLEKSRSALYKGFIHQEGTSPFQKAHLAMIEDRLNWLFVHTLQFKAVKGMTTTEDELKVISEYVKKYQQEYNNAMTEFLKHDTNMRDVIAIRLSQGREQCLNTKK